MIITEFLGTREDGVNLYRKYSDKGVMLLQEETGLLYGDPVDIEGAPYNYKETDILIEDDGEGAKFAPDEISPEEFMMLIEEAL